MTVLLVKNLKSKLYMENQYRILENVFAISLMKIK